MALGEERFVGLAADFEGKLRMKTQSCSLDGI